MKRHLLTSADRNSTESLAGTDGQALSAWLLIPRVCGGARGQLVGFRKMSSVVPEVEAPSDQVATECKVLSLIRFCHRPA